MTKFFLFIAIFTITFLSYPVTAKTIEELVNSQQLQITIQKLSQENPIARQAIIYQVEVATNRWFSRGTRIENFDLENAVVLPVEGMAFNSSRTINGETWATQARDITIYPLDEGDYTLPKIKVFVSVNSANDGIVEGYWELNPVSFSVRQPKQLALIDHYVVTDTLAVKQRSDYDKSARYQVGDSITQTIEISAERVPAMMLPELTDINIEGVSVFDEQPILKDNRSRGEFNSSRQQTRTYIFEQAGDYVIPRQTFYYWDPDRQSLKKRHLKALKINVASDPNQMQKSKQNEQVDPIEEVPWNMVFWVVLATALAIVVYRKRDTIAQIYRKVSRQQRRHYRRDYLKACNHGEFRQACESLFRYLRTGSRQHPTLQEYFQLEPQRTYLQELIALAYDINEPNRQKKLVTRGSFDKNKALSLLKPEQLAKESVWENRSLLAMNPRRVPEK